MDPSTGSRRDVSLFDWIQAIHQIDGLSAAEDAVLCKLALHVDWSTGRKARPKVATISRATRLSRRTVQRTLGRLVARGYVTVDTAATPHAPAEYRLNVPGVLTNDGRQAHLPEVIGKGERVMALHAEKVRRLIEGA